MNDQPSKMNVTYANEKENNFNRNWINDKPEGWVICDTVNNPFFPIDVLPYDTSDFDLNKIQKEFHRKYGGKPNDLFLPWHFTIDIVNNFPYIINTRPFNYKTMIPEYEKKLLFMIIGDANIDIYTKEFYHQIANYINSFKLLRGFSISTTRANFEFFIGKNFNKDIFFSKIQ